MITTPRKPEEGEEGEDAEPYEELITFCGHFTADTKALSDATGVQECYCLEGMFSPVCCILKKEAFSTCSTTACEAREFHGFHAKMAEALYQVEIAAIEVTVVYSSFDLIEYFISSSAVAINLKTSLEQNNFGRAGQMQVNDVVAFIEGLARLRAGWKDGHGATTKLVPLQKNHRIAKHSPVFAAIKYLEHADLTDVETQLNEFRTTQSQAQAQGGRRLAPSVRHEARRNLAVLFGRINKALTAHVESIYKYQWGSSGEVVRLKDATLVGAYTNLKTRLVEVGEVATHHETELAASCAHLRAMAERCTTVAKRMGETLVAMDSDADPNANVLRTDVHKMCIRTLVQNQENTLVGSTNKQYGYQIYVN